MAHFRSVNRCATCDKIYRSDYFPILHGGSGFLMVCGRCGGRQFERTIAKPRLFGLLGWEVGAENIRLLHKKCKPSAEIYIPKGKGKR